MTYEEVVVAVEEARLADPDVEVMDVLDELDLAQDDIVKMIVANPQGFDLWECLEDAISGDVD